MIVFLVFIFGTIIGSFLNVCIYRIPLGRSIVRPGSSCCNCGKLIQWFDNIPLLSYLILKGKCRHCSAAISFRYFLVEMITALSGVGLLLHFSLSVAFVVYFIYACALIIVVFVDIERREIPDEISIPGIFVGILLMMLVNYGSPRMLLDSALNSILGAIVGWGSMFLLAVVGELIFRKEALGGGDMKLMAMIGAFLGWKLVLLTFFISPLLGTVAGIVVMIRHKENVIAYGPYLALGSIVCLLYGEKILSYIFFGF